MPTTPEGIIADITEATAARFRGSLIARGQARAIIWRNGILPPDSPNFDNRLSYDLSSYGYALLGLGLRLRELGGDAAQARLAFEQAATALEFDVPPLSGPVSLLVHCRSLVYLNVGLRGRWPVF